MKKLAVVLLSASLLSTTALAGKDTVVGTYKGGKVTQQQVMQKFKPVLAMQPENKGKDFPQLDEKVQELLVRGYINQKLFEAEAEKLGIRKSKEFQERVKMAESQILQQELIERHLKTAVTDKMIDNEYKNLEKSLKGQKEVRVSHILVKDEDKAKEIKKKLNKGSKFEALVQEFSNDEGSKANKGDIGFVMKGQLVPEFESKAFSMKKGEISDPVKTQFGWHIIKVLDSRLVKIPPKDQAISGIKNKLSREAVEKYFTKLAEAANIKITLK